MGVVSSPDPLVLGLHDGVLVEQCGDDGDCMVGAESLYECR